MGSCSLTCVSFKISNQVEKDHAPRSWSLAWPTSPWSENYRQAKFLVVS
jgi:hypothetical protein